MSKLTKALTAAAGNAGAGESLYVEDVFSTYLYTGNSANQTIINGIDLAGEGGLVWTKRRDNSQSYGLFDTERGVLKYISSNTTDAETTASNTLKAFNSDGFQLGGQSYPVSNQSGEKGVSWTFRKAEKFFDVVTWTGNGDGTDRYYNHNLGSVPNCIIVKRTDAAMNWAVYHLQLGTGADSNLELNTTDAIGGDNINPIRTTPSSTRFHVRGSSGEYNENNATYVAYLFASDAGGFGNDGSESIIKCGSWDATGNNEVNLGFEPQWILIKNADGGNNWGMFDSMRGWTADGNMQVLSPNLSSAESSESGVIKLTSTGFTWIPAVGGGNTYIYIAIRRPMKTPESGTEVFKTIEQNWSTGILDAGFPVDLAIFQQTAAGNNGRFVDRLRGKTQVLNPNLTSAEGGEPYYALDNNEGFELVSSPLSNNWVWWMFKRATGFFDVVAWTAAGTLITVKHNLGVIPELIITKYRGGVRPWGVAYDMGATTWKYMTLPDASGESTFPYDVAGFTAYGLWTKPTNTQILFRSGLGGNTGDAMVGYLFASVAGVSKVGSYTGTGSNVNVDCGFSAGARFILIKRTDSSGDWYVWDSERGIVAGNDPYLLLNSTAAEVTSTDYIDPLSSGFTVTSSAPAALNASGGTYIFLAIA